jgi:RNA-directed DNA polymerase
MLTAVIFAFTLVTQEFVYGVTFITASSGYTVSVGVPTFLVRGDVCFWGSMMAACVIAIVPIAIIYNFFVTRFVALKVGTVEDGRRTCGVCGAPKGAVISPILANVYLHYVFDVWVHRWRLTKASGDMIVIRYADDTIVGFQHEHEARAFLDELKERMRKFELALHPDKTRLICFGRHAAKQREKLGEGKPETFDFLGFTHFCTRSRKWGTFVIGRKTIKKRMRAKLLAIKIELRRIMHDPIAKTGAWVKQMLKGHLNYFAVSGNHPSLWWFFNKVKRLWLASLKRRSKTARLSWERFIQCVARFFPPIRTIHPLPCHRFDARTRGRSPVR